MPITFPKPKPKFEKLYAAKELVLGGVIPGLTQESLLKLARKHGIGKKAGRIIVFRESDIPRLIEALPCSKSSHVLKAS